MRNKTLALLISAAVIPVMLIVGTVICGIATADSQYDFEKYPVISDEDGLKKALRSDSAMYIVDGLTVSGDAVENPFGFMTGKYLYIECCAERCEWRTEHYYDGKADITFHEWNEYYKGYSKVLSDNLLICGAYKIDFSDCEIKPMYFTALEESDILPEASDKISGSYIYPDGTGDTENNIRFRLSTLSEQTRLTFTAKIGGGRIEVAPLTDERKIVVADGNIDELKYYASEGATWIAVLLFCAFAACDAVLWFVFFRCYKAEAKSGSDE